MNKPLIILLLGLICLYACDNTNNEVIGSWIEVDNFDNPIRLDFSEFTFDVETNDRKLEKLFHIHSDTLFVEQIESIYKSIIEIKNDTLRFFDIETDSVVQTYERTNTKNIIEYFNLKQNVTVELPELKKAFPSRYFYYNNTLIADWVNNELVIFFNGKQHNLNDTSFLKIYNRDWKTKTRLLLDKNLNVGSLNLIKTELRKAQYNTVGYIINDSNNNWVTVSTVLPPIDSLSGRPLPPPPNIAEVKYNNLIVEVNSDSLTVNGNTIKFEKINEKIKALLRQDNESVIRVYFDEKLKYELYLNYLSEFQKAYIELRNEYAFDKYNMTNYLNLQNEEIYEVRKKYRMQIHEVTREELIKYAL